MRWIVLPISEIENFRSIWEDLNAKTTKSPLLSLDFLLPLLQIFGDGKEKLAYLENEREIDVIGVFRTNNHHVWMTFQVSQAPLGFWLQKPDIDLAEVLPLLLKQLPSFPLLLAITQQDPDLFQRPPNTNKLSTIDYIQTARVTIAGDFEDYWAKRGKNLRQNIKKQRNKLEKAGITARLDVSTAESDVSKAINDYGRLENAGWKAGLGTAIHPSNKQGLFYQSILENFCRQGKGRIYRYWFNDKIVAMDLCIEGDDSIVILKTTYDECLDPSISPAFLMRDEEFKQLFTEKKFSKIEFYGKVMDWHTKWANEFRTLYHVNYYHWATLKISHTLIKKVRSFFGN